MPPEQSLPRELLTSSFSVEEALALGVTPRRLRAADLIRPSRGIRIPELARETLLQRARPYTAMHDSTVLSHFSAAMIHRIPLPAWAQDPSLIDLSRARAAAPGSKERLGQPRRPEIRGHRLRLKDDEVMMLDGAKVTTPARTWLDLCGSRRLRMDDVIAAGEFLVSEHERTFHPRTAIVPLADLRAFVESRHRVVGLGRGRIALELLAVGVDSPQESYLRQMLERAGLPRFIPNRPIVDPWGGVIWVDVGNLEFRTALEYEGEHHFTEEQMALDAWRDRRTRASGWNQVKITKHDMARGEPYVVKLVVDALRDHGYRG
jgi:very-short-patch-repair endonuclease